MIDNNINEDYDILLNQFDFDEIILEYRAFYKESMDIPFKINNILIENDEQGIVPKGRIGLLKN